jgi:hypothetical protein
MKKPEDENHMLLSLSRDKDTNFNSVTNGKAWIRIEPRQLFIVFKQSL